MTNSQIRKATPKRIAQEVANFFLYRNIEETGREFDNLWENGRGDEIAREFTKLYKANPELQRATQTYPNSRFFSPAMLRETD